MNADIPPTPKNEEQQPDHPLVDMLNQIGYRIHRIGPDHPAKIGEFYELQQLVFQCSITLKKLLKS